MTKEKLEEAPYLVIWEKVFVDGKPCKAFRLGKFGYEELKKVENKADSKSVWNAIAKLQRQQAQIFTVLNTELKKLCKKQMVQVIQEKHGQKNFRSWSIHCVLEERGFDWQISRDSFSELVADGIVQDSKRGWYKLKTEAT
jgi:hypothetical protein